MADIRLTNPTVSEFANGARGILETATSNLFTRQRAAQNSAYTREANIQLAQVERESAQRASVRRARIGAQSQVAAASLRANTAATASQRLLTQFEAEKLQRDAIRQRQTDQAVGQTTAAFGASGVKSAGAAEDVLRGQTAVSNLQAIQGATRKESISQQAKSAITGAQATGISAAGSVAAASQFGQLFSRQVSQDTGIDINRSRFF